MLTWSEQPVFMYNCVISRNQDVRRHWYGYWPGVALQRGRVSNKLIEPLMSGELTDHKSTYTIVALPTKTKDHVEVSAFFRHAHVHIYRAHTLTHPLPYRNESKWWRKLLSCIDDVSRVFFAHKQDFLAALLAVCTSVTTSNNNIGNSGHIQNSLQ